MIEIARTHDVNRITYKIGDSRDLSEYEDASFDIVLTMFLFNYLNIEDISKVMKEIFRMLKPGGKFIMAVPHPSLSFLKKK
jgi:ubiquinone/menaquinone biosynthesis C-methylase UbiE